MKYFILIKFTSLCAILFFLTSCNFNLTKELGSEPYSYIYRFSIKNETTTDLDVKLLIGEIPNPQARFEEFALVPDELLQSVNEFWSNDLGSHCMLKPNKHDAVYNIHLPIWALDDPIEYHYSQGATPEEIEKQLMLREKFLDRFFSFVLTVSINNEIVYRVVGWDVPDEGIEEHHINDKLWGYYDTALESYDKNAASGRKPLLYSKLWSSGLSASFSTSLTYFIKINSGGGFLQEFNPHATHVDEDEFWK